MNYFINTSNKRIANAFQGMMDNHNLILQLDNTFLNLTSNVDAYDIIFEYLQRFSRHRSNLDLIENESSNYVAVIQTLFEGYLLVMLVKPNNILWAL